MNIRKTLAPFLAFAAFAGCGPKEEPKTVKQIEEAQALEQKQADDDEKKIDRKKKR